MKDAGRIGFVIRGEYDSSASYEFLDVVLFGNSSYVAKKSTKGNEPKENNEYWQLLAKAPETEFTGLASVAFSGSYTDLSNKPTIPAAVRVKGGAESSYRTGDVNITLANIGILSGTSIPSSSQGSNDNIYIQY